MSDNKQMTDAWHLYELGKNYNMGLDPNYYNLVDTNIEFFTGNQWKGLANNAAMATLPKPVFNITKRIGALFVASLTSSATKISYEPLAYAMESELPGGVDGEQPAIVEDSDSVVAADMLTSETANLFEKLNMDYKTREALFDGVQTGDYCAHFYWDPYAKPFGGAYSAYRGEIKMELVDGTNVMFGNPNTRDVEAQPYILITGRDLTSNLAREYCQHHPGENEDYVNILPDSDNEYQSGSGGKLELSQTKKTGKALFIYKYFKKTKEVKLTNADGTPKMEYVYGEDGEPVVETTKEGFPLLDAEGNPVYKQKQATELKTTVWVSKHTKTVDIFEPIDTGLSYYPIAWGNWEHQKNIYHGRALVTGIIPNQIYINSMFALIMRHQQMLGFPKTLYDANVIGQWNNAVGQAIAVYDLPPDKRMSDLHSVIQPADMSTQIMQCIDKAMVFTKECLGATDAQLGNVRPDNTSALIALQSSSQVPLENPQACKYEWFEQIGRILPDMMATYYGKRPIVRHREMSVDVTDPTTGMPSKDVKEVKVVEIYDFSRIKDYWLNAKVDVGASTYWSRIAVVQTLDNLKQGGVLDVIDYLERMPDEYIPRKAELIAKFRKVMNEQAAQAPQFNAGAEDNNAAVVASMPDNIQQAFNSMGGRTQNALLKQAQGNALL